MKGLLGLKSHLYLLISHVLDMYKLKLIWKIMDFQFFSSSVSDNFSNAWFLLCFECITEVFDFKIQMGQTSSHHCASTSSTETNRTSKRKNKYKYVSDYECCLKSKLFFYACNSELFFYADIYTKQCFLYNYSNSNYLW